MNGAPNTAHAPDGTGPALLGIGPAPFGQEHIIANGQSLHYWVDRFPGPLSLKSIVKGSGTWSTEDGHFRLGEQDFLVLNGGQTYSLLIESQKTVETLCVFFKDGFVEEVQRTVDTTVDGLLDRPADSARSIEFPSALWHKPGSAIGELLSRMYGRLHPRSSQAAVDGELIDDIHYLAEELVKLRRRATAEMGSAPGLRAVTREEIYRRLQRARSFVDERYEENLSVETMAEAACLSVHHFHRSFTQVFRRTPHQYLIERRLQAARALLAQTDAPIGMICAQIGFASLGSFSSLFKRKTGHSPDAFRREAKKQK